jgi:hypothetical protein
MIAQDDLKLRFKFCIKRQWHRGFLDTSAIEIHKGQEESFTNNVNHQDPSCLGLWKFVILMEMKLVTFSNFSVSRIIPNFI